MQIVETEKFAKEINNLTTVEPVENVPTPKVEQENIENISPIPKGTEVWWRYGNYCGPGPLRTKTCDKLINGHPLPGAKDEVDQACMDHDLEYCEHNMGWKDAYLLTVKSEAVTADKKLINTLKNLSNSNALNWKQRMAAKTIIGYFSLRHKLLVNPQKYQELPSSGNG